MDPLATETSEFWKNYASSTTSTHRRSRPKCSVADNLLCRRAGSLVNSGRVLQWHWQGADPPGEAKSDLEIMEPVCAIRKLYKDQGGKFPDPISTSTGLMRIRGPDAGRNGDGIQRRALADLPDPKDPAKVLVKRGEQLSSFAQLRRRQHRERLLDLL